MSHRHLVRVHLMCVMSSGPGGDYVKGDRTRPNEGGGGGWRGGGGGYGGGRGESVH